MKNTIYLSQMHETSSSIFEVHLDINLSIWSNLNVSHIILQFLISQILFLPNGMFMIYTDTINLILIYSRKHRPTEQEAKFRYLQIICYFSTSNNSMLLYTSTFNYSFNCANFADSSSSVIMTG